MIATAFGTASSKYTFPTLQASDEVVLTRPPIIQQTGGSAGAYDYFHYYQYPLAPAIYIKKFTLSATTYAGIEAALQALKLATIGDGTVLSPTELYATARGGTPDAYSTRAKCISFKAPETYGHNYTTLPVELQFQLPQPWWFSLSSQTTNLTPGTPSAIINYSGTLATPVDVAVLTTGGAITAVTVSNTTTGQSWTYSNSTGFAPILDVRASLYTAQIIGIGTTDCYADMTFNRLEWLSLVPGNNTLTVSVTGSSSWLATFSWYERWGL